jgi:hypothetical protein
MVLTPMIWGIIVVVVLVAGYLLWAQKNSKWPF